MITPFYDPEKTYEENYRKGPFGAFANTEKYKSKGTPAYNFLGQKVYLPFGISAGPLLNSKYVIAALNKGFDIVTYKTVRTSYLAPHPWPNVVPVKVKGNLSLLKARKGVTLGKSFLSKAITNSFGIPSMSPDIWQPDMAKVVRVAKKGHVVIGSFQGTTNAEGNIKKYINDFVVAARLVKETGAKILEVNLSCPNEGSDSLLCFDTTRTKSIIWAVKNEIGNIPLVAKIAYFPNRNKLEMLIKSIGDIVQGIAAINSIPAVILDTNSKQALPGKNRVWSGICGKPIYQAALSTVKVLKDTKYKLGMNYTIIGVGGVTTVGDYQEFRKEGADIIMSATGTMWNPYFAQEIKAAV